MNVNSVNSLFPSLNNTNPASSVQQQADTLGLSPADQFLAQLQQVQIPQQYQAMISQITGQPQQPSPSGGPLPTNYL
jgi:hypothetical protein